VRSCYDTQRPYVTGSTQFSTRVHIYYHESRREYKGGHNACNLVENYAIINKHHTISTSIMYDDYDLDYTYASDYSYDLDEYIQDLDEDYARDGQDYETLAYRHYA